jgi:hypothetical protein
MKHVGTDNLLLYALCRAAIRLENIVKTSFHAAKRFALGDGKATQAPTAPSDVSSAGRDHRLGKGQAPSNHQ